MKNEIYLGDCIQGMSSLPDKSVNTCITSPPYYGLRDYGCDGQIGLEETPESYVQKMVDVFREVKRVLRDDGEDTGSFDNAVNGWKWKQAVWEIDQWLRSEVKYNDKLSEEQYKIYNSTRDKIRDILGESGLTL
jgi:DNA modification methylase